MWYGVGEAPMDCSSRRTWLVVTLGALSSEPPASGFAGSIIQIAPVDV